jgi:hypothetical protein
LGPFKVIDSVTEGDVGPIWDLQQRISGEMLGPFKTVGSISQEECWAHSRPSTACLKSDAGPVQDDRQRHRGTTLGPSKTVGCMFRQKGGPIQGNQHRY